MQIKLIEPPEHNFYAKRIDVFGTLIKAHAEVADDAVFEAAQRVGRRLGSAPAIAANLATAGAEMHVIGRRQRVTHLPMYRSMRGVPRKDGKTMDERGRGYGGLHSCCSEDSLLNLPTARHHRDQRDICSHEFAHAIHRYGLDVPIQAQLERRFGEAKPLWRSAYAATNVYEFFAELTMWYVGSRGDYGSLPAPEAGPDWLARHDPDSFALLDEIYSGRLAPEPITWEQLEPSAARSSGSALFPVTLLFVNESDRSLDRFWLNARGARKLYGTIPPGAAIGQPTFVGHCWALADDDGNEIGVFTPTGPPHACARITQELVARVEP